MTKQEAVIEIANMVDEMKRLDAEIVKLAEEHKIVVRLNITGKDLEFDPNDTEYGDPYWMSSSDLC